MKNIYKIILIKNNELLETYIEIWGKKVKNSTKKEFDS